ncbi:MAG: magnesium-translocating P-type ATPase, partial [Aquificaceae bacterium]
MDLRFGKYKGKGDIGAVNRLVFTKLVEFAKMDVDGVLLSIGTDREGLSLEEAKKRLKVYGLNEVAHEKPPPWYLLLLKAYASPFAYILIFLASVSLVTDVLLAKPEERDWSTVIIISTMLLISGFMRFVQEYRSNKAAEKLKAMVYTTGAVKRKETGLQEIKREEVVPGDIVHLSAGDMIPADMRIITSKDLFVNQATLTGESEPVEKHPHLKEEKRNAKDLSIYDLENICFMGTSVVSGSAIGVVLFTGENTYIGSMARAIVGQKAKTSFEKGLDDTSKLFIKFMVAMFPIVFVVNGLTKGDWFDALMFALAVALGLTPEMLPLIVTGNLAKGAIAMAKKRTIVKRLDSIQNFGSMDILCTDKTGTLTLNKVVLKKALDMHGDENDKVLRHAFLNSYYQTGLKNLLDLAILEYGEERGLNGLKLERIYRKVDEIPFDFVRRRMSVVLESDKPNNSKKRQLVTKGAVEEILSICQWVEYNGRVVPLTEEIKGRALELVNKLNKDGMRVLAVAQKNDVPPKDVFSVADESNMVLIGFLAFLDPPKETAPEAIRALKEHGVEVKILTGDNETVTKKVCKDVGLQINGVLLGEDIDKMDDAELIEKAENTTIFAKVTPMQKARIIRVLKFKDHVVGFLGDGINDAPAMKEADVAISVDNAVDIAKESAEIILLEKSLMVLENGVLEGRRVFGNILKYLAMTASSNFGNVFSVMVASVFLPFLPMAPIQLVLLDMIYHLSMGAIPWD